MKKIIKLFLISMSLTVIIIFPSWVYAESSATNNLIYVGNGGNNAPYQAIVEGNNDLAAIVGSVIEAMLGILGVLFLVYIVYAGYNWMIAQGDEEKVTKAKETIQRAIIGLIITIGAYAISVWVFDRLLENSNILN